MSILAEKCSRIGGKLLDAVLPQECLLCSAASGSALLCEDCLRELPRLPQALCPRCGVPAPTGETCGRCQRHPPHFDALVAALPYAFPIDRMLQHFKYGHQLSLADWFGKRLAEVAGSVQADMIIPLPMHSRRMAERGFNQALEVARPLARRLDIPLLTDICERHRETTPQEGLNLLQRRRNLRNAFVCRSDLAGQRILLVDDVVTTAASVNECARTLRLHGAAIVNVAAVARTLLPWPTRPDGGQRTLASAVNSLS